MERLNSKIIALIVAVIIFAIVFWNFAFIIFLLAVVLSSILFLVASPFAIWWGLVLAIKHFKKSKIPPIIFLSSVLTLVIGFYMAITAPIRQPAALYMLVFLVEVFSYFAAVIAFAVMRHSQGKKRFAKDMILFSLSIGAVLFWSAFLLLMNAVSWA